MARFARLGGGRAIDGMATGEPKDQSIDRTSANAEAESATPRQGNEMT